MPAPRDQRQALIAEIQAALAKASPKLPWVVSNEAAEQRQLLKRAQQCLQALDSESASRGEAANQQASDDAGAVLRQLLYEMQQLRQQMVQPLQTEITQLQQRRTALLEEVQQLEQARLSGRQSAAIAPDQLEQLFQALASRLETQLQQQVHQSLRHLDAEVSDTRLLSAVQEADGTPLSPAQRLAYLKSLQTQSDQVLLNLDQTFRTVFDNLHQSLQSYQASLSRGLDEMHTLGEQGEMMFQALINHLTQRLNQSPVYLDGPAPTAAYPARLPADSTGARDRDDEMTASEAGDLEDDNWSVEAIDALDLDIDFDQDDDITLLQLDDEMTQLDLGQDLDLDQSEESESAPAGDQSADLTEPVPPSDPLQLLDQLEVAAADPEARVAPPSDALAATALAAGEASELDSTADVDGFYESLFGAQADTAGTDSLDQDILASAPGSFSNVQSETSNSAVVSADAPEDDFDQITIMGIQDLVGPDTASPLDDGESVIEGGSILPASKDHGEDEPTSLDTLFGEPTGQELLDQQDTTPVPETIASLAELLPDETEGAPSVLENQPELVATDSEAAFVTASPDEDLLATDDLEISADSWNLDLDSAAIDQLGADLSALEQGTAAPSPSAAELRPSPQSPDL
ncbi:hypothetical protein C7271_17015, partial [filamentous cyanobacterium CCP5]